MEVNTTCVSLSHLIYQYSSMYNLQEFINILSTYNTNVCDEQMYTSEQYIIQDM